MKPLILPEFRRLSYDKQVMMANDKATVQNIYTGPEELISVNLLNSDVRATFSQLFHHNKCEILRGGKCNLTNW